MDKLTNYRNKIKELTDELHHYVNEYDRLVSKKKQNRRKEVGNVKKKEKEKSCQKRK